MKRFLLSILIMCVIITLTGCGLVEKRTKDGKLIGTSNESNNKLQIKITTDQLNIRKEKVINSEIVGVVQKGSIFDVIDHEQKGKYQWVHIKTNNNIEGYVASFEDHIYYEFINGDVDFIPPKLEIKVGEINVDSYSQINDEYINSIVEYSDDKDKNLQLTYEVSASGNIYHLNIKVKDKGNNEVVKKVRLNVKNERLASTGKWLTIKEVRDLRKKFLKIIRKYGRAETYDMIYSDYWKINYYGSGANISVFEDIRWFKACYFKAKGNNIDVEYCEDSVGKISYEEMHKRISKQEKSAKNAYLNAIKDLEKTGYKLSDVFLNI